MKWTEAKHQAALLVAQGRLTFPEIAKKCGMSLRALGNYREDPEFKAEVQRHVSAWRERTLEKGIADKDRRLFRLNDRWRRALTVIDERAKAPEMQKAPGGRTGLLARTQKVVGYGDSSQIIDEFAVDTGLLREIRELEAQAAAELGQWDRATRAPGAPVVLVVAQGSTNITSGPAQPRLSDVLPQSPVAQLPGVVIDLVPERGR